MFSQASVSHSVHCGGEGGVQGWTGKSRGYVWGGVVMSKGGGSHPFPRHWTRGGLGVDTHPLLLIPNGGHHIYGRQAGGAHPTGMLS